jgi:ferredoxin
MKAITQDETRRFLESLTATYDVRVPVRLHDGTRALGRMDEGELALAGGPLTAKPTAVFFPQCEKEFSFDGDKVAVPAAAAKPLLVVGLTAEDAECLAFIDRFYGETYRDDLYFAKRDGAVVIVVSGRCGADGEFLKIAGGNCDIELVCDGERFFVAPCSDTGARLCEGIAGGAGASLEALQKESDALSSEFADLIEKTATLVQQDKIPEEFWAEVGERCIACTSCNLACPTCTCFEMYDSRRAAGGERNRLWDSCQLGGFMREASGHNPLGTEGNRTRRRIHHKLAADPERWGTVTCFLCGRCDKVCPTGIGIEAVSREIVARYG